MNQHPSHGCDCFNPRLMRNGPAATKCPNKRCNGWLGRVGSRLREAMGQIEVKCDVCGDSFVLPKEK